MNRIELAMTRSDIEPLAIETPSTPVAAVVAAFFTAAAIGYAIGYTLHQLGSAQFPEDAQLLDAAGHDAATVADLLSVRGTALTADLIGAGA